MPIRDTFGLRHHMVKEEALQRGVTSVHNSASIEGLSGHMVWQCAVTAHDFAFAKGCSGRMVRRQCATLSLQRGTWGSTACKGNTQLYREALRTNDPIVHDDNEGKLSRWGRRKTHDVPRFTRDKWYLMLKSSLNPWGRRIPEVLDVFACDHQVGLEGSLMPP